MPARATSSGTISFGLVSIPVRIYPATRSRAVRFNLLRASDKSRLKQQYVAAADGAVVDRDEIVKGYEYARGQYVVMSDEELKALEQKTDHGIEIEDFVPVATVDPVYFDRSQLLGPDKGGSKAYRLLREAMAETEMVAVGRFSARGRQQLVLIRPMDEGLAMHSLFYADEVRGFEEIDLGDDAPIKPAELDLARQLIEQLAGGRFDPGRYEDEYRRTVLEAIEKKVAGEEVVTAPAAEPQEKIIDLVAALKKSLAEKRGEEPGRKPARKKAGARRRKSASGS
jgi:DNA end-binding protein Ku